MAARSVSICLNLKGYIMRLDRIIAVRNDKTIYRDGEYCMKVFVSGHTKSGIFAEALNQARAEETGLPVPKLSEVTMLDGKWTIVSELIRGKSLELLSREEPEKRAQYLEAFIDLQIEVQSKDCEQFPALSDKLKREIDMSEFDGGTKSGLLERLSELTSLPDAKSLCHGDFALSNVIRSERGLYILDWAHASAGYAAADAARSYLLFWLSGDIDGAERYLRRFSEKSGVDAGLIRRWMPLAAASQMKRCRFAQREFLLGWVKDNNY